MYLDNPPGLESFFSLHNHTHNITYVNPKICEIGVIGVSAEVYSPRGVLHVLVLQCPLKEAKHARMHRLCSLGRLCGIYVSGRSNHWSFVCHGLSTCMFSWRRNDAADPLKDPGCLSPHQIFLSLEPQIYAKWHGPQIRLTIDGPSCERKRIERIMEYSAAA